MDWKLLSQQLMRHVQDNLPSASIRESDQPDSDNFIEVYAQQSSPPDSMPGSGASGGSNEKNIRRRGYFESRELESRITGSRSVGPFSTSHIELREDYNRDPNGMERLDTVPDSSKGQQMRAAMRKVELVESRLSVLKDDMGNLKLLSSRAEGTMTALQGRQDRLDTKACDVSDAVTALERRCMLTETALHGTVTHGQMMDSIHSIFELFREKVEDRLSHMEAEVSNMRASFAQVVNRGLSEETNKITRAVTVEVERLHERTDQLKSWIEGTTATEVRQRNVKLASLKQQVEGVVNHIRANESRADGQEAEIRSITSTMDAVERTLASTRALDAARIRRELADAENSARRRIEEVCAADIRRIDDVYGELRREREARMEEIREVCKEVSNVRTAVQETNLRLDGTHERLHRFEVSVALSDKEHEQRKGLTTPPRQIIDALAAGKSNALEPPVASPATAQRSISLAEISSHCTRNISLSPCAQSHPTPNAEDCGEDYVKGTRALFKDEQMAMVKPPAPMSSSDISLPIPLPGDQKEPRRNIKEVGDGCGEQASERSVRGSVVSCIRPGSGDGDIMSRGKRSSNERPQSSISVVAGANVSGTSVSPGMQRFSVPLSSSPIIASEGDHGNQKGERVGHQDQASNVLKQECEFSVTSCSTSSSSSSPSSKIAKDTADIKDATPTTGPRLTVDPNKCIASTSAASGDSQSGEFGYRVEKSVAQEICGSKCTPLPPPRHGRPSEEHDDTDNKVLERGEGSKGDATTRSSLGNLGQDGPTEGSKSAREIRKVDFPVPAFAITTTTLTEGPRGDERVRLDSEDSDTVDKLDMNEQATQNALALTPAQTSSHEHKMENIKKSMQQHYSRHLSARLRDSGVATAQCEFCLRHYTQIAMRNHLQVCELRMVQCPYQCGVKMLVRNLEKHKEGCSLRGSARGGQSLGAEYQMQQILLPPAPFPAGRGPSVLARRPPPPTKVPRKSFIDNAGRPGGVADRDRAVTCMRCHESLPFHLVPSHSPQCKGSGSMAPSREVPPASPFTQKSPSATLGNLPMPEVSMARVRVDVKVGNKASSPGKRIPTRSSDAISTVGGFESF